MLDIAFLEVRLFDPSQPKFAGFVRLAPEEQLWLDRMLAIGWRDRTPEDVERLWLHVQMVLAGGAAERRLHGELSPEVVMGAAFDLRLARAFMRLSEGQPLPTNWQEAEPFAIELSAKSSERLQGFGIAVASGVDQYWDAIEAVAKELLEAGSLQSAKVREIYARQAASGTSPSAAPARG